MSRGRPPLWNPYSDLAPGVWTEAVELTSKDRLSLPAPIRKRLPWLSNVGADGLLAVLDARGSAELIAWKEDGERLIAAHRERLTHVPDARRTQVALAMMDAFMRLSLEQPGRLGLPANLTSFLNMDETQRTRVVAFDNRVWLWSEQTWQARRVERLAEFAREAG